MSERAVNQPITAEQWKDYIADFADKLEFGTPEFCAISDFHNLQRLYGEIGRDFHSDLASTNGEVNLTPQNRTNLILQRIALLEHAIGQNQSRILGYATAYREMAASYQHMVTTAKSEAEKKFPNQEENQTAYVHKIYEHALDDVFDSIYEKKL